eukprot:CAMPEP_0201524158 /NCGR_PEP_ID=MMETSP0161_2-20130828/21147_1 /ASSEMBLY_ACC=CAM_ASM_000251 /TAXON_ID=180227 /ORGANISM="Neoparamoeba aestuarina, Strain SoJaBio B1-5/56/2" /LENGTH=287 /DNA_ID=CAMNT_0047923447 /DNA_START=558 /DNA_END=1418 /DNA_ORIENTATION=-
MVMYKDSGDGNVSRHIVYGPAVCVPQSNEWAHQFVWTGKDHNAPPLVNRKTPGSLVFHAIRLVPDQMYFDVEGTRTADDALLDVRLMIFYQITDLDLMMDRTQDPLSELINSVTADVMSFVNANNFENFKENSNALNTLDAFPHLTSRSKSIGIDVSKVVFRGYVSANSLQQMHDESIETRTKLKLQQETELVEQELADVKQGRIHRRDHEDRLEAQRTQNHKLEMEEKFRQAALKATQEEHEQQVLQRKELQKLELSYFDNLRGIGVDMTKYFVSQNEKNVKVVRV